MHRIVALPNKARRTNRYVGMSSELASPPCYDAYFDARQEGYAGLGIEASKLQRNSGGNFVYPQTAGFT